MNHTDHVNLLRGGILVQGGVWADFGSGTGAFTLALADLIGSQGQIISIDQDANALREQERHMRELFPAVQTRYLRADFNKLLDLPRLDGIVMANSLHFHSDKLSVLSLVRGYLRPGGRLILVEYNADSGNRWVPHPLSYDTWEKVAAKAGFVETRKIGAVPSRFLREIYSAVSIKPVE